MKLTRKEKEVLDFIGKAYPIPWDKAESKKIIAIGERLLPTLQDLAARVAKSPTLESDLEQILKKLIGYQCVHKVYLAGKGDFSDYKVAPGETLRTPIAGPQNGIHGYQITPFGKEIVAAFYPYRFRAFIFKTLDKIWEAHIRLIAPFLIGIFVSSLFGLDIHGLAVRPQGKAPPEGAKDRQIAPAAPNKSAEPKLKL